MTWPWNRKRRRANPDYLHVRALLEQVVATLDRVGKAVNCQQEAIAVLNERLFVLENSAFAVNRERFERDLHEAHRENPGIAIPV